MKSTKVLNLFMRVLKNLRLRLLFRRCLTFLPKSIRHGIYRRMTHIVHKTPPNLELRIAESQNDLESAFKLLHDCYVSSGLMTAHPSGMRITKYHALPSTTTLIALWDGEVVGTVSLVRRSSFGLPMENIFDLSELTETGARIVEVSALAIRSDFSGQQGKILFPLCKFLHEYSCKYFGADYFAICVNPKWMDFYEALLLFKPLKQKTVKQYSFVNGAPASGGILDLRAVPENYQNVYGQKDSGWNLHRYFLSTKCDTAFQFPERRFKKITDPVLTPELLSYFFCDRTDVFSQMKNRERHILNELYRHKSYQLVLPKPGRSENHWKGRSETRFEVECSAKLQKANLQKDKPQKDIRFKMKMRVVSVAHSGIGLIATRGLRVGEIYSFTIEIGPNRIAYVEARVEWHRGSGQHGLRILNSNSSWNSYIQLLQKDLLREKTG